MKSGTPLKVTVLAKDQEPHVHRGRIAGLDDELSVVAFTVSREYLPRFDLQGASFRVGKTMVEVQRGEDLLTFEEVAPTSYGSVL